MSDLAKVRRIKKRLRELEQLYDGISADKMKLVRPLIENASFMEVELDELQKKIQAEGAVDNYQNGASQKGQKISASMQAYNNLMKSYNMVNTRLEAMLPTKPKTKSKLEALIDDE